MSSPPESKKQKLSGGDSSTMDEDPGPSNRFAGCSVQDLMPLYYARIFPHQLMYKWLVYGNDGKHPQADASFFQRRELCFTLEGDIFARYQSFKDGNDMAEAIMRKCPTKIDIGPVYNINPQDRKKFESTFAPVERELVFDIDLTDYDDVRTCGKEGHICTKCWPLMAAAIQVLDRALREDFGWHNLLWVYSGRRGVHCWVCDPSARGLSDDARSAVASYLSVYKGHEGDKVKLGLGGQAKGSMHPAVEQAAAMLKEAWPDVLIAQRLLEDDSTREAMLKYIPDESVAKALRDDWSKGGGSTSSKKQRQDINLDRWQQLESKVTAQVRQAEAKKDYKTARQLARCLDEIVFAHVYPRLDMEVSKKMNHLLKAPFCVHPKTGKVCVPIDPSHAHEFDPDAVPTVHSLLQQLPPKAAGKATEEWQATDMAQFMEVFQKHFLEGCSRSNREQLASKSRVVAARPTFAF